MLSIYLISGSLALLFYFIPSGQVVIQVTVFVLCQGFMVGVFYMIGTYTQDVFSTDIRGTTFNFLDCVSKVTLFDYLFESILLRYNLDTIEIQSSFINFSWEQYSHHL